MSTSRTERFIDEIRGEFPSFKILYKRASLLQRAIHVVLAIITLGGQRVYLTRYHTVLFGTLWVPDVGHDVGRRSVHPAPSRARPPPPAQAHGDLVMTFVYLVPFFPLFFAWGRARIRMGGLRETIRATAEVLGVDAAANLRPHIVKRFTGPEYGWMWPFPKAVNRWFDEALADVRAELGA